MTQEYTTTIGYGVRIGGPNNWGVNEVTYENEERGELSVRWYNDNYINALKDEIERNQLDVEVVEYGSYWSGETDNGVMLIIPDSKLEVELGKHIMWEMPYATEGEWEDTIKHALIVIGLSLPEGKAPNWVASSLHS